MHSVTLAGMRAHAARLVASTVAIVIAVGFVVATLVLHKTATQTIVEAVAAQYVNTDAVVISDGGEGLAGEVDALAAVPGVEAVEPSWRTSVQVISPAGSGTQHVDVESTAAHAELRWQHLSAGRLPATIGEVAVSERVDADVGDLLPVTAYDAEGVGSTFEVEVTGVVDLRGDPTAGVRGRLFTTPEQAQAWGAADPGELRIAGAEGTGAEELADAVSAALGGAEVRVVTGAQMAQSAAAGVAGDQDVVVTFLLAFATIAVLVAGLVIANTFAVLLAQRTRELALLRCVGATARQVRRSVMLEALLTGLLASVLGVAAGIGLSAAVAAVVASIDSPVPLAGVSIPRYAPIAGLVVGTLTTLLAAAAPARSATRIAPLAALRPLDATPLRSRAGMARLSSGAVLLALGVVLMGAGVTSTSVLVAVFGIVLSSLGGLLLAQRAVPMFVGAAGRLLGRFGGVPGRLAAGNAVRNPRRTAATATALLIGVTLTTAMVVGASSTRATADTGLDTAYPMDVVVNGYGRPLPASVPAQLASAEGVVAATTLEGAMVIGVDGEPMWVTGVEQAQARPVLRSADQATLPDPGHIVLGDWLAQQWGVQDGDRVTFRAGEGSRALTVITRQIDYPLMTTADLRDLVADTSAAAVWLRLADDVDQNRVIDRLDELVGVAAPNAFVAGLASERAALHSVVDVLLLVVTGLLGIAVLIALIGVGNTLALSVLERRQEVGLLRALGLPRKQLYALLAWEAVLIAGVAAVVGVLVGGVYGTVAIAAAVGEVIVSIPWLQVGAIVAGTAVAGSLASVLPARRAAMTSPVAVIAG